MNDPIIIFKLPICSLQQVHDSHPIHYQLDAVLRLVRSVSLRLIIVRKQKEVKFKFVSMLVKITALVRVRSKEKYFKSKRLSKISMYKRMCTENNTSKHLFYSCFRLHCN